MAGWALWSACAIAHGMGDSHSSGVDVRRRVGRAVALGFPAKTSAQMNPSPNQVSDPSSVEETSLQSEWAARQQALGNVPQAVLLRILPVALNHLLDGWHRRRRNGRWHPCAANPRAGSQTLGCGYGRIATEVESMGFANVIGLDYEAVFVASFISTMAPPCGDPLHVRHLLLTACLARTPSRLSCMSASRVPPKVSSHLTPASCRARAYCCWKRVLNSTMQRGKFFARSDHSHSGQRVHTRGNA